MSKFLSRKLIMTLVTALLVPALQHWGVPQDTINWLLGLVSVYLGGQSIVDTATVLKAKTNGNA